MSDYAALRYQEQYKEFEAMGGKITHQYAIFSDLEAQAGLNDRVGITDHHYFHQDLLVASFIHKNNPEIHIDIGSRIDSFVAHVAAFRSIIIMDVRELPAIGHEQISFIQADLMDPANVTENITDSISCLHAIEHFGLGRYGDPIDPQGHIKGFDNIVRMLQPGGMMYISFPIGRSNEVHFNAHRVFHPKDIFNWSESSRQLELQRFDYVDDGGAIHKNVDLFNHEISVTYGCGIYSFRKKS